MNEVFIKRELSFVLKLGLFSLVLIGIHLYIFENFFSGATIFFPLWQVYTFHVISVFLIYTVINYKYSNGKTVIFNVFLTGTLLKMILAMLFLLPLLLADHESKKLDVMNFFLPYFLFLAFEVYNLNFFLNKNN